MESFRRNLSENTFIPNWNLSGWNLSDGIFQTESFRKYFQQNRNLSEWNLSEGIFQKQLFDPAGIL
jgi:uncharacterized protein YjbI with pentapeptide repeats